MNIVNLLFTLFGYTFFDYTSSDEPGGKNNFDIFLEELFECNICTSLKFKIGKINIHIHHWLVCFIGIIFFKLINQEELGYFCLGGMIHGIINYSDWKKIINLETF